MRYFLFIFLLLIISCKSVNPKPKEVQEYNNSTVEEYTDSDADGVIDFREDIIDEVPVLMSPAPPPPDVSPIIESVVQPELGRLVYNIPTEMIKFDTYKIEVKIARNVNNNTIVVTTNTAIDTIVRTSATMQVELIDPTENNFKIVSQSDVQFIETTEHTTWVFFVTPLKKGDAALSLVVSIIKDGNLKQSVFDDNIVIKTSTWIEVKTFLNEYWQWIIMVFLLPLGKYLYSKHSQKKIEKN